MAVDGQLKKYVCRGSHFLAHFIKRLARNDQTVKVRAVGPVAV